MQSILIPTLENVTEIVVRQGSRPEIIDLQQDRNRAGHILAMFRRRSNDLKSGIITKGTRKGKRSVSLELSQGVKFTAYVKPAETS